MTKATTTRIGAQLDDLAALYAIPHEQRGDWRIEKAMSTRVEADLAHAVPPTIIDLFRAERDACDHAYNIYRSMRDRRDISYQRHPGYIAAKNAQSEAWNSYEFAVGAWITELTGRPAHMHERGRMLVVLERITR